MPTGRSAGKLLTTILGEVRRDRLRGWATTAIAAVEFALTSADLILAVIERRRGRT